MDLLAREKRIRESLKNVIEDFQPNMLFGDFNKLAKAFLEDSGIVELLNMACETEYLKEYQKLEAKGLLVKLELKVGDTVIWDDNCGQPKEYTITGYSFGEAEDYIDEPVVTDEIVYYCTTASGGIIGSFASSEIRKSVFLKK